MNAGIPTEVSSKPGIQRIASSCDAICESRYSFAIWAKTSFRCYKDAQGDMESWLKAGSSTKFRSRRYEDSRR
jgi:hypothetical protein